MSTIILSLQAVMIFDPLYDYVSVYCLLSSSLWPSLTLVLVIPHFTSDVHFDIEEFKNRCSLFSKVILCSPPAYASTKASSSPLQKSSSLVSIKPARTCDPSPPQCLQTARWNPLPSLLPPPARTMSLAKPTRRKITPRILPSPFSSQRSAKLSSMTLSTSTAASLPSRR